MVDSLGPSFAATVIVMTVLAFTVMCLRLFIRTFVVGNFGNDDWFIITAMLWTIVMSAMMLAQVHYGLGNHIETVSLENQMQVSKWFYVSVIFYNGAVGLVKISILLQYLRIFATKAMQKACYIVLILITMFTTETVIISIFDCTPIEFFWNKNIEGGHCVDFGAMWFSHSSLNITFDVVLIILPMPVIKSLNLPRRQKIALMGIFALGGFVTITSFLRLHSIYQVSYSHDVTYDNVGAAQWSCIEINTAIICASLPTFKAIINRIFPRLLATTQASSRGHRSRNWGSRYGPPSQKHHQLQSLNDPENGDAIHLPRREGAVRTNCEKGAIITQSSDVSRSTNSEDGIKVVTVVTQQRSASDELQHVPLDDSRAQSLTHSERGFFPQ